MNVRQIQLRKANLLESLLVTKNIFSVSFVTRMPGSTESSISSLGDCEVKHHINVFFKSSLIRILEIEGLYDQKLISG